MSHLIGHDSRVSYGGGGAGISPQDLEVIIAIKQGLLTGSYEIIKNTHTLMI